VILTGCAGWSLPRAVQQAFGAGDSHLARLRHRFPPPRSTPRSIARTGGPGTRNGPAAVPAIPLLREAAEDDHPRAAPGRLRSAARRIPGASRRTRPRLACLLVQLPPSFAFDARLAGSFLALLRGRFEAALALEPRHASWFTRKRMRCCARRRSRAGARRSRSP
jgi:hypothetical protein